MEFEDVARQNMYAEAFDKALEIVTKLFEKMKPPEDSELKRAELELKRGELQLKLTELFLNYMKEARTEAREVFGAMYEHVVNINMSWYMLRPPRHIKCHADQVANEAANDHYQSAMELVERVLVLNGPRFFSEDPDEVIEDVNWKVIDINKKRRESHEG